MCSVISFIDLTEQSFNRLKVIKRVEDYISPKGQHQTQWLCKCCCEEGNEIIVTTARLISGNTQSCGCLRKEQTSKNFKKYNQYILDGEYGVGYTSNTNQPFYFDLEDYNKIKQYCWWENSQGYILAKHKKQNIRLHRFVTNCPNNLEPDHINHNPKDNRKENLVLCTHQINCTNQSKHKNNTSGYIGISWSKLHSKWKVQICYNNHNTHIGLFDDIKDAIKARKDAEEKYFKT